MTLLESSAWSVTYDRHSDDSRCVIYDRNIFIIQAASKGIKHSLIKPFICGRSDPFCR
jgi:hypothetical protein